MKHIKTALIVVLAIAFGMCPTLTEATEIKYDAVYKDELFKLVIPTYTMAIIRENCNLREAPNIFSKAGSELKAGSSVEILQDYSEKWYKVENSDEDAVGWIPSDYLDIQEEQPLSLPEISKESLEAFANIMNFPTNSDYFIWTDIARQRTYVFKKADNFTLVRTLMCSTGKSSTPTTRGFFFINGRGKWFYSSRLKSGGMYWVRFNETYLFHSLAMDKNKNVTDNILGERRSSGCVRLSITGAKWLYENIPDGTSVFIH